MGRSPCCPNKEGMNRGAWTAQEDELLRSYIKEHGEGKWRNISKLSVLKRCGKSCRLRWLNYLRPDIKRGNISKEEEDLIIRLHKLLGNRWALIAGRLPGRTDNEIKNYWNTSLGKKVKSEQQEKEIDNNVHRRSMKAKKPSLKFTNVSNTEQKKVVFAGSSKSSDADEDSPAFCEANNFFPNVEVNFEMGEFLSSDVCDSEFWKICDLSFSAGEMLKDWIPEDDCQNPEATMEPC